MGKPKGKQPGARSLERCRQNGWLAATVEKWNPHVKIRVDLFGFGDIIALDGGTGSLLIQATTQTNAASRVKKILGACATNAIRWLTAGNRIEVWGWAMRLQGKARRWSVRVYEIGLDVFGDLCVTDRGIVPKLKAAA